MCISKLSEYETLLFLNSKSTLRRFQKKYPILEFLFIVRFFSITNLATSSEFSLQNEEREREILEENVKWNEVNRILALLNRGIFWKSRLCKLRLDHLDSQCKNQELLSLTETLEKVLNSLRVTKLKILLT